MEIVPGILTNSLDDFKMRQKLVEKNFEKLSWVQVDFIDGVFANNETLSPSELKLSAKLKLKYEAHLQVNKSNLLDWTQQAIEAGYHRITTQIESMEMPQSFYVDMVLNSGSEVGISLDDESPVEMVDSSLFDKLSVVQVMTIKAGFSGQKMNSDLLDKVKKLVKLRSMVDEWDFKIEVDGGVTLNNVKKLQNLGVDLAEVNSGLFADGKFEKNLNSFLKLLK